MKNLINLFLLLITPMLLISCNDDDNVQPQSDPTITELAQDNSNLSILVDALVRAGLDDDLANTNGDFTVFAPTNDAFMNLLDELGVASLEDIPVPVLEKVLLNHVIGESKMSTELMTGYETVLATESSSGNNINLYVNTSSGVMLNGESMVTTADVEASNGVIHIVNDVINLPTIVTFAVADPTFDILQAAVTRPAFEGAYVDVLGGTDSSPFTVFAPTNDAFVDLLAELELNELSDIDDATLGSVLEYHVVAGANVLAGDLQDGMMVTTFQGGQFEIDLDSGAQIIDFNDRVTDIVVTDVQTDNGVIHVINQVLLPDLS